MWPSLVTSILWLAYLGGMGLPLFSSWGPLATVVLGLVGLLLGPLRRWWPRGNGGRRWRVVVVGVLGIAGIWLMTHWVAGFSPTPMPEHKVVVLGLDGLSPVIVERMMAQGMLPNFHRLAQQGAYRRLATTNPALSPVAWASFATGTNPGQHGLFDFLRRDPTTYLPDWAMTDVQSSPWVFRLGPVKITLGTPRLMAHRKGVAFWQVASAARVPAVILRCPATFPPDKIRGRMLSGLGVPDLRGTQGTFTFYTTAAPTGQQDLGGRVVHVTPSKGVIETAIVGPRNTTVTPAVDVTLPMRITVDRTQGAITVIVAGESRRLAVGSWSQWWRFRFPLNGWHAVSGIGRFYLGALEPDLTLYLSPINFDPYAPAFSISHPPQYAGELADALGLYHTLGQAEDTWALNEGRFTPETFLEQCDTVLAEREAMWFLELTRFTQGLLVGVFDTPDRIQHMFWRMTDPGHPGYTPEGAATYGRVIETMYQRMDAIVGKTLAMIDDRTVLIVLSDHGFTTFRRVVHLNRWLERHGWLSQHPGFNVAEAPLFQTVNWAHTQAYAVGLAGIYVNMRGRERAGAVEAGQAPVLTAAIRNALLEWRDPKTGDRVVRTVYDRDSLYHGPYVQDAPDLIIGYEDGYRASWQTALGAVPAAELDNNLKAWSGDHNVDPELVPGVFLINRPVVAAAPKIVDLAPTILQALGVPIPDTMEGQALQ